MKKNILIVDDNAVTITLVKQSLEHTGKYTVFSANNGIKALEITNSISIDLIITDVIMPEMDGVDLYKALKSKDITRRIPIIVITDNKVFRESFSALGGVDDFLAKPVKAEELLAKVKNLLKLVSRQKESLKVIVLSNTTDLAKSMFQQLERLGCNVVLAKNSINLIEISLLSIPNIILIDVLMKDLPSRETIKALKCFIKLSNAKILAYTHFMPEELGDTDTIESIKEAKNNCLEAGATKYIGRYAQTTFSQSFYEYI